MNSQTDSPRVSIIIPALNAQAYIEKSVTSALSQTCPDIEVIVVDDGSSDGTVEMVEQFAKGDARVRLFRHGSPRGPSAARNTGIAAARGEWISPLDADDAFAPNRIDYLLRAAHETGIDLIADNLMLCSFPARLPLEPAVKPGSPLFARPITLSVLVGQEREDGKITLGHLKPLIRRRFIERNRIVYREDLRVGEDFAFYVECLLCDAHYILLPEPLYYYSLRPGSASYNGSISGKLDIYRLNRELLALPQIHANEEWRRLFGIWQRRIERVIASGTFAEALKDRQFRHAAHFLLRHPQHIPACAGRLLAAGKHRLLRDPYRPRGMRGD